MFRISVLVALLSLGFGLVGCGDNNNNNAQEEVIDDILGGRTINGCESAEYEDLTASTSVTITDISAWVNNPPHKACIVVSAGTAVTWQGNFGTHPLVGGETPTTVASSPITQAMANSGTDDVTVTFNPTRGTAYPYFCTAHLTDMQGVIVVLP